ncbi:hypothetical protein [Jiangella mangrovi]|uniref:Uncharacterized protein n=1 Tax=Jiangella mangrovi TaxID=1524084 RepID=A0A7W9LPT1_9ACTN|nr:hypothetical protein [Jiangella mangrovi]MBB5791606.1 hypothetical protein [Jiangella mangrovi]
MGTWDPFAAERLASIGDELHRIGLVDLAREAIADVWRANTARHEPEELFDDSFTLGVTSTRNLANRLAAYVRDDPRWRATGAYASREYGATVLHTSGLEVRMVKAPSTAGRHPDFIADFDWQSGEMRHAAAARNRAAYGPPPRDPSMATLFELELPDAATAVQGCRDVFLAWGADLASGLTAGWLGLPTTSAARWLAVTRLWWDEPIGSGRVDSDDRLTTHDAPGFEDKPAPVPTITLKPRVRETTTP